MISYLIVTFSIVFLTLFDRSKLETFFFWAISFVLLIFSAFRIGGTSTADYDNYLFFYSLFTEFKDILEGVGNAEIGFRVLSYIGNTFNFEGQFIIVSMAMLSLVPVLFLVKKYSFYPIASLVFLMPYFLTMNMHSSRTSVAAAFGLLAINYFYQSNRLLYILFFSLAISFHSSAICLVLILLTKLNHRKLLILLVISVFLGAFVNLLPLISTILEFFGLSRVANKIISYQGSENFGYRMAIYDPRIILNILICLLIYNIKGSIDSDRVIFYFKTYFIGTILLVALSSLAIVSWRISYYFLITSVLVIPALSKYYNTRFFKSISAKRLMSTVMVFVYSLYFIPLILTAEPYEFYFKL